MSTQRTYAHDDDVRKILQQAFSSACVPTAAQIKLEEAYAQLAHIPQAEYVARGACEDGSGIAQTPGDGHVKIENSGASAEKMPRKGLPRNTHAANGSIKKRAVHSKGALVIILAAAAVVLAGCVAYAATVLFQMGPNGAPYFEGDNLPAYDSMQQGTANLSVDVGESIEAKDVNITLDSVSSDRSIIHLFFTLEKEGGFDLDAYSLYEGSQEGEWARLQQLAPFFSYAITDESGLIDDGILRQLDAYMEDGKVKCMMRITPRLTLPDTIQLELKDGSMMLEDPEDYVDNISFTPITLDLSTVPQPKELGAQEMVFNTKQGEKFFSVQRFTVSELGIVMIAKDYLTDSYNTTDHESADEYIHPAHVKISDGDGNIINIVDPGDGRGGSSTWEDIYRIDFSGILNTESGITFTPMAVNYGDELGSPASDWVHNEYHFDITQIGAKLPTSEFGGYEIVEHRVEGSTVSTTFRPYGWILQGYTFEVFSVDEPTLLEGHSAIWATKTDYFTGEVTSITSYYAATEEELKQLTQHYCFQDFNAMFEDSAAAKTFEIS